MDNIQLQNLLQGLLGDVFCGVWASDRLPSLPRTFRRPAFFIVNTHPAHKPGEHWLALTLEENNEATFFDSWISARLCSLPHQHFTISGKTFSKYQVPQYSTAAYIVDHLWSPLCLLSLPSGLRIIF